MSQEVVSGFDVTQVKVGSGLAVLVTISTAKGAKHEFIMVGAAAWQVGLQMENNGASVEKANQETLRELIKKGEASGPGKLG